MNPTRNAVCGSSERSRKRSRPRTTIPRAGAGGLRAGSGGRLGRVVVESLAQEDTGDVPVAGPPSVRPDELLRRASSHAKVVFVDGVAVMGGAEGQLVPCRVAPLVEPELDVMGLQAALEEQPGAWQR